MRRALVALLLAGCSRTEVVVTVSNANLDIPNDVDTLAISVRDESDSERVVFGLSGGAQPICHAALTQGCITLPVSLTLFPGSQHPDDVVNVQVTASKGAPRIDDLAEFRFTPGLSQPLVFGLYKSCLDVSCVAQQGICDTNGQCVASPLSALDGGVPMDAAVEDAGGGPDMAHEAWKPVTSPSTSAVWGLAVGVDRVYAGLHTDGVRFSLDNGMTWQLPTTPTTSLGPVTNVAADRNTSVYAATGTTTLWRSDDSGVTFNSNTFATATMLSVTVDPFGAVYFGSSQGPYKASGPGGAFGPFSTGMSGTQVINGLGYDATAQGLYAAGPGGEWSFALSGTQWSSFGSLAALGIAGENGRIWLIDGSNFLHTNDVGFPAVPGLNATYRVVTQPGSTTVFIGTSAGVMKTKDGISWKLVLPTTAIVRALAIDPANASIVWAGDDSGNVWRSTTGGE
jgi:hypothetical protein